MSEAMWGLVFVGFLLVALVLAAGVAGVGAEMLEGLAPVFG